MFEYKIPPEIKAKLTNEFMSDFLNELINIFDLKEPIFYSDCLTYFESTCGWVDAFECVCAKHKLSDVFTYYDKLAWYDSDIFDDEVACLLVEYDLIKE